MQFAWTVLPGRPFSLLFHIIHSDFYSLLEISIAKYTKTYGLSIQPSLRLKRSQYIDIGINLYVLKSDKCIRFKNEIGFWEHWFQMKHLMRNFDSAFYHFIYSKKSPRSYHFFKALSWWLLERYAKWR